MAQLDILPPFWHWSNVESRQSYSAQSFVRWHKVECHEMAKWECHSAQCRYGALEYSQLHFSLRCTALMHWTENSLSK